jgi:hypothetical protein
MQFTVSDQDLGHDLQGHHKIELPIPKILGVSRMKIHMDQNAFWKKYSFADSAFSQWYTRKLGSYFLSAAT